MQSIQVGDIYLVVVYVRGSSSDNESLLNSRLYHSILLRLVLETSSSISSINSNSTIVELSKRDVCIALDIECDTCLQCTKRNSWSSSRIGLDSHLKTDYYNYYYYNYFMAPWTLSGTTRVSQYQKVHFTTFWIFWRDRLSPKFKKLLLVWCSAGCCTISQQFTVV